MAAQTKNVPQIRFKGFSEAWEEKPVGDVLTEVTRSIELLDHQKYQLVTVKRRNEGIVSRGFLRGRDILVKNYSQLRAGDYIISKRQVVHGANGIVPQHLDKAIVSNEYLVAVGNEKLSAEFLTTLSTLPDMYQKFFLSSYGVDIEKLFFDVADWKKRNIVIPKLAEQNEICSWFAELDRMIELHQQKHEKLVALKKAMLKKMFPAPGATTPEIRFKGFSEPWEDKKLGEICDSYSGGTPSVGSRSYYGEAIPFIRSAEINSTSTELSITDAGLQHSSAKMVNKGDILYALYGATSGEVGISQVDGAINQAILAIKPKSNFCSYFLATWLRSKKQSILGTYLQGGQGNLSGNIVKDLDVSMPQYTEQQKIGAYFRQLDELIEQHAMQVEKLKQIKAACLEKMFV